MNLEEQFHAEMLRLYEKQCEVIRRPIRLRSMIHNMEGLGAARALLQDPTKFSDGFIELLAACRLDLSVEALVLKEPWCTLFCDDELDVARGRLGHHQP